MWLFAVGAVAASAAGSASAGGAAAHAAKQLVIYSVAVQEEFNNHSDDRVRGAANNPFGNFAQSKSVTREPGAGPFAGDRAVFVFKLYADSSLKKGIGSATLACQYGFSKRGICQAEYLLGDGTVTGIGGVDFNSGGTFALAVTGGTGKYQDVKGEVRATPAPRKANRVTFSLL